MTPKRPYILSALYDWIIDNAKTPYILVDATFSDVYVPKQFIQEGKIVLNISPEAAENLALEKDQVHFTASFSGVVEEIYIPMVAVLSIYSYEDGSGIVFDEDEYNDQPPSKGPDNNAPKKPPKGRPNLKVVD